jgi:shikimate kinase
MSSLRKVAAPVVRVGGEERKPLALLGFMGSGKSVVGALVAERAGAPFHDLDLMVEDEAGMTIPDIFAIEGEAAFRALEKAILPKALEPGAVVALGGGVVMDDANWSLVADRSLPVYLEVPFTALWHRVHAEAGRPLIAGRSQSEVEALFEARRLRYEKAPHRVKGDQPISAVAEEVLKLWSG